ncbi:MAG: TatD family hydrolase, partial [Muribaculaceae bacterium]|nr:TatD family hydrolase [Muribaculaceae bacterium]
MRFIDTHTHLYLPNFNNESEKGDDAVRRAIDAGVDRMIFPNVDKTTVVPMLELADRYPDNIYVAMGLHPTEIGEDWQDVLSEIESEFESPRRFVAVGEIGIDLYWDKTFVEQQMQAFERQVARAA